MFPLKKLARKELIRSHERDPIIFCYFENHISKALAISSQLMNELIGSSEMWLQS